MVEKTKVYPWIQDDPRDKALIGSRQDPIIGYRAWRATSGRLFSMSQKSNWLNKYVEFHCEKHTSPELFVIAGYTRCIAQKT
jgi:hypothetical protein